MRLSRVVVYKFIFFKIVSNSRSILLSPLLSTFAHLQIFLFLFTLELAIFKIINSLYWRFSELNTALRTLILKTSRQLRVNSGIVILKSFEKQLFDIRCVTSFTLVLMQIYFQTTDSVFLPVTAQVRMQVPTGCTYQLLNIKFNMFILRDVKIVLANDFDIKGM
jgi:hypothetical protein